MGHLPTKKLICFNNTSYYRISFHQWYFSVSKKNMLCCYTVISTVFVGTLWLCNSSPWKIHPFYSFGHPWISIYLVYTLWLWQTVCHGKSPFLIGKPSISITHLYHGYVSHSRWHGSSLARWDAQNLVRIHGGCWWKVNGTPGIWPFFWGIEGMNLCIYTYTRYVCIYIYMCMMYLCVYTYIYIYVDDII